MLNKHFITMILAAGGVGSRMGAPMPKQYLPLAGRPVALHSFDLFCQMEEIDEIVVVCDPQFRPLFASPLKPILFANPGKRRQDSIYQGFCTASKNAFLVATHDSARPFIEKKETQSLLKKAIEIGAATLAAPVNHTIKKTYPNTSFVEKTLERPSLWEIQTPQAMRYDLFERGFALVSAQNIDVTDDTSLAELLQAPVAIVPSPHRNFKITTPTDFSVAQTLCKVHAV